MPADNNSEISYRVKCVVVESERVFGDIVVTQQTRDLYWVNASHYSSLSRQKLCNLTKQILETPDFMALNRKPKKRELSVGVTTISPITNRSEFPNKNVPIDNEKIIANTERHVELERKQKSYPLPMLRESVSQEVVVTSLVDQLLLDIYGYPRSERGRSESDSTASSYKPPPQHRYLQQARLLRKSKEELLIVLDTLEEHVNHAGGLLVRQLRRRDYLTAKRDKQYDVITAHLQAYSAKRSEDTRMRFSLTPQPGESGFTQWLDAMKMVARLQGGIPQEFRKRLWLTLSERHLDQRGIDWKQAEKLCFNEWSNPDDEELGIQIVKDLHRTGCSLFCGAAGRDNQAVLRRVLLGFARWNKSVGYCQGLNVLAALVLQVTDRAESSAVKVMIYLIEGVLPEGYFADNLRGLSIDMAVFRDLLRMRLPKLSRHLEALQNDAKDKATGSSYEPPLTNVFTMQWFLTLFCHCLPQEAVLRVWDLIFLEGDEVLLRTALAIWEGISDRIMTVTSADEFYSIMGVLTREMLEFTDVNNLIKTIVNMGPLHGVTDLREKHRYNITPWARRLSDEEDTDTEDEERLVVAAAMFGVPQRFKKDRSNASSSALQTIGPTSDKERIALDISTLKHQYAKLRERQRQAHIILSAACARQSMVPSSTSQAMNHLLVGKSALVSAKTRQLGPPPGAIPPKPRTTTTIHTTRVQGGRRDKHGVTLHWKDTKKPKDEPVVDNEGEASTRVADTPEVMSVTLISPKRASTNDSDSDSTSTELCDEPDRLSDVDSEEPTSTSDCYVMATDDEKSPRPGASPIIGNTPVRQSSEENSTGKRDTLGIEAHKLDAKRNSRQLLNVDETSSSISKITDQIRRLSASDDNNLSSINQADSTIKKKNKGENDADGESDKIVPRNDIFSQVGINVEKHFSVSSVTPENDEVTRINCHVLGETFEMVDRYDFLSNSDKTGIVDKSIEPKVPSGEKYCEIEREKLSIAGTNNNALSVDVTSELKTIKSTTVAELTELESKLRKDGNEDILRFEASSMIAKNYEKDKPITTDLVVYDSSKHQRDSCGTLISSADYQTETITDERTFYSPSYVIGHLPISPATVNEKLSRATELSPMNDNIRFLGKEVRNFDNIGIGKNVDTNLQSVTNKIGTESEPINASAVFTSAKSSDLKMPSCQVHKSTETNSSSSVVVNNEERVPDGLTLFDNIRKTNDNFGYSDYIVCKSTTASLLLDPKIISPDHSDVSSIGNERISIDKVGSLDYGIGEGTMKSLVSHREIVSTDKSDISSIGNARISIDKVGSLDYDVCKDKTKSFVSDSKIVGSVHSDISLTGNARNLIDEAESLTHDVCIYETGSLVSVPKIVSPVHSDISLIGNAINSIDKVRSLDHDVRKDETESFVSDLTIVGPANSDISLIGNARNPIDKVESLDYGAGKDKTASSSAVSKIVSPVHFDISLIASTRNLIETVGSLKEDLEKNIETTSIGLSILPLNDEKMSLSVTNTSSFKLSSNYVYTDSLSRKIYEDKKKSPKTPDSGKSFSSGETMGPDSKNSSLTTSPRSLMNRSDSRIFPLDKSERSSMSSDSKTLTLCSLESENVAVNDKMKLDGKSDTMRPSLEKSSPSTPISTDSLKNKSEISPKFVISSSSESCSPGKATKSSERSFSSDLQSPISANSIKYRTSYTEGQDNLSESSMDICSATSPFYPIVNPNEKTPSPYGINGKHRINGESEETWPEEKSTSSKDETNSSKYNVDAISLGVDRSSSEVSKNSRGKDEYDSARPFEKELAETLAVLPYERPKIETIKSLYKEDLDLVSYRSKKKSIKEEVAEEEVEERYMETDTVSPLPSDKYEANRSGFIDKSCSFKSFTTKERDRKYLSSTRESFKPFERSCSSLETRFADLNASPSSNELSVNTHKKRSSDILQDLKHLEAKTSKDGKADTLMLTRKTGYVWEDLKNLEARRQDNFSDSASEFTRERLDPPRINVFSESRKSYVVEPKINPEAGNDSILTSYSRKKSNGEPDDDRESKLGVWTKVKPRVARDNGRRSSDRALKIIQENSAILHKILTCQAKKRLPDLEEISKEITISPINEEISKIFSPILEKMGLNEHEINEELARINFKDFDQMTTTSGSEFDAKMNDELSKLSLIDDNEIVDHMDIDDVISRNYLDTREALIDRQINEELSKLLANYEEASPICMVGNRDEASSSCQNQSEIEALDISSISTNVFSYQSSNESIETKSELDSIQDTTIHPGKTFSPYTDDAMMTFAKSPKYSLRGISPKSDIDIYRELEKLDKISSGEILPSSSSIISQKIISPMSYGPECPIYTETRPSSLEYCIKPDKSFERSPMKSPYDTYKPYDFKSRISPRKTPSNPYSARSYDKSGTDKSFDFHENLTTPSSFYDVGTSRPILSKETLEFRVRYDDETSKAMRDDNLSLEPYQTSLVDLDRGASYYSNETSLSLKRLDTERTLQQTIVSPLDCTYNQSDLYTSHKYDSLSPKNYSYGKSQIDYDKHESYKLDEAESYLSLRRKNSHSLSPNYQYDDHEFGSSMNPYSSELSGNLEETCKRPISHPEFVETIGKVVKYQESTSREAMNFRKASLSLGPLDSTTSRISGGVDTTQSPISMTFSPFPIRNSSRKPKELGLKLGLYSPSSSGSTSLKRS